MYGIQISSNLSTHCLTIFTSIVPWQPLSLMVENMKFPRKLLIFSALFSYINMNLTPTISTRTNLRTLWGCQTLHQHHHESQWLPTSCFLLCMTYTCHLLNVTASPTLGGITPIQALTGQVPDISFLLHFTFWTWFITRLIKVSLTPTSLHIPMKNVARGLVLLKTKGMNSLGSSSQMIPR